MNVLLHMKRSTRRPPPPFTPPTSSAASTVSADSSEGWQPNYAPAAPHALLRSLLSELRATARPLCAFL